MKFYLFIYGCTESSLLCTGFSLVMVSGVEGSFLVAVLGLLQVTTWLRQ